MMLASDLVEVICAAHLSFHVDAPFHERGGLMLVGAPGVLKTTFVNVLDQQYHDAVMMSDVNAKTLTQLRDAIATGTIRTLVLPEFSKIYERHVATASNVEGVLRAMVAEGFQAASFDDQRVNRLRARAMLVGALTPHTVDTHFVEWENSGFNRRFLWCLVKLADADVLERAVVDWQLVNFHMAHAPRPPMSGRIPMTTTRDERQLMRSWVKYQPGGSHTLHLQLLTKIVSVLRWWYRETGVNREAMETVGRFAVSLGREGDSLELEAHPTTPQQRGAEQRRLRKEAVHAAASQLAKRGAKKKKAVKTVAKKSAKRRR